MSKTNQKNSTKKKKKTTANKTITTKKKVTNSKNVPAEIGAWEWLGQTVTIGGVEYELAVATYQKALAPGETSIPSLKQVYLDKQATNE